MNRTDRLVAMVMHMQGRRVVRAEELSSHFAVSVRTIYRDIAALGEAGVPISGEAGVGYSLVKSYHLPPIMLTIDEATALFVGGEMVKRFTDPSLSAPMTAVLDKLRAVLPKDRQDYVERLAGRTVIVGLRSESAPDPASHPWLLSVQRSVAQRLVLRFIYHGRIPRDETERIVEPLGIVFYSGAWYLVAWCRLRDNVRHFRLDRIQRLTVLDEHFPSRVDFSLTHHLAESRAHASMLPVRVWFSDHVLTRARNESYATLVEEKRRDLGCEYSLTTYSLEWLAGWLLSFGVDAEAIAPIRLRELVCSAAEEIAQRHALSRTV